MPVWLAHATRAHLEQRGAHACRAGKVFKTRTLVLAARKALEGYRRPNLRQVDLRCLRKPPPVRGGLAYLLALGGVLEQAACKACNDKVQHALSEWKFVKVSTLKAQVSHHT